MHFLLKCFIHYGKYPNLWGNPGDFILIGGMGGSFAIGSSLLKYVRFVKCKREKEKGSNLVSDPMDYDVFIKYY